MLVLNPRAMLLWRAGRNLFANFLCQTHLRLHGCAGQALRAKEAKAIRQQSAEHLNRNFEKG